MRVRMWVCLAVCAVALGAARGCSLGPGAGAGAKSPGDNYYRLIVNGEVERYAPGSNYVVTLVGSRTHDVVQQFARFQIVVEPLNPHSTRSTRKLGQFQLFADTLTKFDEECSNSVVEADDLPKTEVQVMWKAPVAGSGCVLLKAMVYENASRWFAEDGQLTKRVCEDTALSMPDCCACDDAKYRLVFEGLWSPQTHPKDFPTQALWLTHFSDVIGATHSRNFTFWGEGQIASDGFRSLAEWGSVGLMERELRQRGPELRSILRAQGLWHPNVNTNSTATFTVDRRRPYVSLASMFGPSPDWVVGVSGLGLCQKDCTWVESKVIDLFPYDAGTDNGISYMSPNSETVPREKISRITPMYPEDPRAPFYAPGRPELPPLARLYVTRDRLITRACDEEMLQLMAAEEEENTQSVNRSECGVSAWGEWSECTVTCGKGLRMRTRQYLIPEKAQMLACDRQLVSKEMCVAALPECQEENISIDETEGMSVESLDALCHTGDWGPWSECSVTCGVGISTRRRQFLDRMGFKKCPLTDLEENRKCMEPQQCTEEENVISDPSCPTTEWSGWSPCSASCGRGVRFRTRLLLVAAEQQRACSARVELLTQRACSERDDCAIDLLTAKRICMEPPQQGPCRGLYQRWSFVPEKGMCVPFNYGGCRGNQNNFLTQDDCINTCSLVGGGRAAGVGQQPAVSSNYPGLTISSIVPVQPGNTIDGPVLTESVDCQPGPWSGWSQCSVSCGAGYQERTRQILVPARPGGQCTAILSRRRRCTRRC